MKAALRELWEWLAHPAVLRVIVVFLWLSMMAAGCDMESIRHRVWRLELHVNYHP